MAATESDPQLHLVSVAKEEGHELRTTSADARRSHRIAIFGARGVPGRYGGFETLATELSVRLVERGFAVTVYCLPKYSAADRPSAYRGVRLIYLRAIPIRSLETLSFEFLSMLHAMFCRYDAWLVLGLRSCAIYAGAVGTGHRVFFHTNGLEWRRRKWGPVARTYLKWSERIGVRLARGRLIADSQRIAEYFDAAYQAQPRYISYGATFPDHVQPSALSHLGLRERRYILVLCRLEPENNVDQIIRAHNVSRSDHDLAIVGGVNYQSSYVRDLRAIAGPKVRFLGPIYDPALVLQLYANAAAYIHGHEVGGTNPALVQAMAAGACTLAKDVSFNRETLGDAGLYWTSGEDLRGRIDEVTNDQARANRLGTLAFERARRLYNWDAVASAYAGMLDQPDRVRDV